MAFTSKPHLTVVLLLYSRGILYSHVRAPSTVLGHTMEVRYLLHVISVGISFTAGFLFTRDQLMRLGIRPANRGPAAIAPYTEQTLENSG